MTYESDEQILTDIDKRSGFGDKKKNLTQIITELNLLNKTNVLFDKRSEQILSEYLFYKSAPYKIFKGNPLWKRCVILLNPIFEFRL